MAIDKDTIKKVAHLARIYLESGELNTLSGQLKDILDFVDKLKKLDVQDVKPTSHILPINNVLRDDAQKDSLPGDKALENAPLKQKGFFSVPRIIE